MTTVRRRAAAADQLGLVTGDHAVAARHQSAADLQAAFGREEPLVAQPRIVFPRVQFEHRPHGGIEIDRRSVQRQVRDADAGESAALVALLAAAQIVLGDFLASDVGESASVPRAARRRGRAAGGPRKAPRACGRRRRSRNSQRKGSFACTAAAQSAMTRSRSSASIASSQPRLRAAPRQPGELAPAPVNVVHSPFASVSKLPTADDSLSTR